VIAVSPSFTTIMAYFGSNGHCGRRGEEGGKGGGGATEAQVIAALMI